MNIDTGGPIFAHVHSPNEVSEKMLADAGLNRVSDGMSLRDWFAGRAVTGLVTGSIIDAAIGKNLPELTADKIAIMAFSIADSLIARKKDTEK